MRKLLLGAAVGAVVLAVAAIAYATTTTTYNETFVNKKGKLVKTKNTSVGTAFKTTATEDQNAENNHQPKSAREFDVIFPAGTKIDTGAAPQCKNLDEASNNPCPKNTQVGSGHAQVVLPFQGSAPVDATVTAYNRKNGLWLYVVPSLGNPVVLKPVFKGRRLNTKVPPTCIASTNQNGHCVQNTGQPGQEAVLSEFDLTTKPVTKGKHVYLKTPPSCPKSKQWSFSAHVEYADGSKQDYPAVSACK